MTLVVITGASSGVGAAGARRFVKEGARVVMIARSADALERLAEELGPRAHAMPCDAADDAGITRIAEEVIGKYGAPDVIVNSAGAGQWKRVQDTSADEVTAMMRAPYVAAFTVTRAFLPAMLEAGRGIILHINSPASVVAWPASAGYTAARAALRGFHEALSQDLAGTGVTSCEVIFGQIASTYFETNGVAQAQMPAIGRTIPVMDPETCAQRLADLTRFPRHRAVFPFMLKVHLAVDRIAPGLTRWMLRF